MANILKFPEEPVRTKRQSFLQDGNDTLDFDDHKRANDYTFPLPTKESFRSFSRLAAKDWSNQELADLFRVKRLLDAAGVANEIDRGMTDEGDPWFLYCDVNGEVFIHLCRIDGVYVLDSPNLSRPLRGSDFNALIEEFTNRKANSAATTPDTRRVVNLDRNGKVFLHPSTMLAALVWTLFLASEELVAILPEEGSGAQSSEVSHDPVPVSGIDDQDTVIDPLQFVRQDHEILPDSAKPSGPMAQYLRDMEALSDDKLGQNTYAIGLSVVAISLGLVSETEARNAETMTFESLLAMISGQDDAPAEGTSLLGDFGLTQGGTEEFFESLTQFLNTFALAGRDNKVVSHSESDEHHGVDLTGRIETSTNINETQASIRLHLQEQPRDARPSADHGDATLNSESLQVTLAEQTNASIEANDQMGQMLSKFGLMSTSGNVEINAREYVFDNNTVFATFNVNTRELETAADLITGALEKEKPTESVLHLGLANSSGQHKHFKTYDNEAYQFITFLLSKERDLEMIATTNELILLDLEIFDANAKDTFAISWSLDNGDVISAIGLRSDYDFHDVMV